MPNTIDERAMNKGEKITIYQQLENLELALNSAEAIGCTIVNMRPSDVREGKEYLIMGLLWQIIQVFYYLLSGFKKTFIVLFLDWSIF